MNMQQAQVHRQAYREMGDPAALKHKDKIFVVSRRGGGHGEPVVPDPQNWYTPRHMYGFTNMLAPLPCPVGDDGKTDTLLKLFLGDDLGAEADNIKDVTLRMILHDAAGGEYVDYSPVPRHHHGPDGQITYDSSPDDPPLPIEGRIERGLISVFRNIDHLYNNPPIQGIETRLEVRINNTLLAAPLVQDGWLVFHDVDPKLFAAGSNLVGVVLARCAAGLVESILIEKLEVHVKYK